ncbi:YHS domain-containing (seleno)protein [Agarivorans aestuarii]|uniref:YHS domain-containing (Seleno)protein n=1 Tax=Agarivorans aestuarii TaxID=1563703 RepID=A0ABU7G4C1_9ALTE|nr:YHS domain-containing (seleno)protein [Agarivorans aestuarii]MEE1674241.1 YHS domain-containing (seleno)protein [Agarivorans aestuarii]
MNTLKALKALIRTSALASALAVSSFSFAADVGMSVDANDLAIKGYDPVAYFVSGQPTQGNGSYTATHNNAIYHFASADNRDAFKADPAKYAPQYGGYCAFGVAMEKKFDTDPTAWKIVDGKLYLNLDKKVQQRWLENTGELIVDANQNWPEIKAVDAAKL